MLAAFSQRIALAPMSPLPSLPAPSLGPRLPHTHGYPARPRPRPPSPSRLFVLVRASGVCFVVRACVVFSQLSRSASPSPPCAPPDPDPIHKRIKLKPFWQWSFLHELFNITGKEYAVW